jgi:hypothetical protein
MHSDRSPSPPILLPPTTSLLRSLSYQTLRTGCITATIALLTIILFKTHPESNLCVMTGMVLGRLYTLTYVANLNARPKLNTSSNAQALSACNAGFDPSPPPIQLDTSVFEKIFPSSTTHVKQYHPPPPSGPSRHSIASSSSLPRRGSSQQQHHHPHHHQPNHCPNLDEFLIDTTTNHSLSSHPHENRPLSTRRSRQFASWRASILKGAEESEADFRGVPLPEKGERNGSVVSWGSSVGGRRRDSLISPRGSRFAVPTAGSRGNLPGDSEDEDHELGLRPVCLHFPFREKMSMGGVGTERLPFIFRLPTVLSLRRRLKDSPLTPPTPWPLPNPPRHH